MNPAVVRPFCEQSRRRALRLCLIIPGSLLLAGCGGGGGSVKSTTTTPDLTPITAPETTPVTTPTTPGDTRQGASLKVVLDKTSVQAGQSARLSATLTNVAGTALVGKTVTFTLGDTSIGSAKTDGSGLAVLNYTLPLTQPLQAYPVKAIFAGDTYFVPCQGSASLTVSAASTALLLTLDKKNAQLGQTVTLAANLKAGDTILAGKTLTFAQGSTPLGTAVTDANGAATLPYTVAAVPSDQTLPFTVTFPAQDSFAASGASASLHVTGNLAVSIETPGSLFVPSIGAFTLNLTVTDAKVRPLSGIALKAGTSVHISDNIFTIIGSATTDASGAAKMTVTIARFWTMDGGWLDNLPPGTYSLPITFAGDVQYAPASATVKMVVQ